MAERIVHQYGAPFRAACGLTGAHRAHGDRGKVTCPDCLALPDDVAARADYDQLVAAMRGHSTMPDSVAPMCTCGHRWWRHQDSSLSPECLDCDCTQFEELTPAGWLARWTVRGAENDAWGERPEDVLLCTHQEESGHCSLPYGHDGGHVIPSAE